MASTVSRDKLKEWSRYFDHLVELIPARFYHTNDDDQPDLKYMKKDARAAEKKARKIKAKEAKRAKLDPDRAQTALDVQKQGSLARPKDSSEDDSSDEEQSEEEEEEKTQNQSNVVQKEPAQPRNTGKSIQLDPLNGNGPSSEDLKARLAKRLEVLRGQRKAEEKKQRVKNAKEWRDKTLRQSKRKASMKRKAENLPDKAETQQNASEPNMQLTFGQLVFSEDQNKHKAKKQKKLSKAELLQEAEKKAADKEKLKASSTGQDELQKQAWNSALLRARGEKILDDPKLLRRSLKKEEKLKNKKGAAWKEREQMQKKDVKDRQKRRRDNLNKRSQDKQKKKIERRENKLMRPGFEGRRATTIN